VEFFLLSDVAGTKPDLVGPVMPSSSGGGTGALIQLILVVAIVGFGIKFLLPKWISKWHSKMSINATGSIRIEESATFAGGSLHLVHVKSKSLLLSVSPQGVQCLADVSDSAQSEEGPAFFELVDRASGDLPKQAVVETAHPEERDLKVKDMLERLKRLESGAKVS